MSLLENIHSNSGLGDDAWRRFVRRWAIVSLLLILVASWFSYGFYQFDEYYQVTELVSYKLGKTPESELAWEYHQRIRPWLQPGVYYVAARAMMAVGIDNPFTLSFAFRLMSGVCSWGAIVSLMLSAYALFRDDGQRRIAVVLLALLWMIPYQAVRTSSESMSGNFLALGVAALVLGSSGELTKRRFPISALALAGLSFGLAFEFRYQIAFAVAGTVLWVWLATERKNQSLPLPWGEGPGEGTPRKKRLPGIVRTTWQSKLKGALELPPFLNVAVVLTAVAAPIALGALVDRWGYGEWTLAPWNYFHVNIVEHKADEFGTDPFYGYLYLFNGGLLAPITLLWTLAAGMTWWRFPRHVVTLTTLPFVLVHSLVAHKEVRFLFPMALIAAPMFVLAFVPAAEESLKPRWLGWFWRRRWSWGAKLIYGANLIALVVGCVTARRPGVELQKYIYDHYGADCHAYLLGKKDPYQNVGVNMYFYRPPGFTYTKLDDYNDLREATARAPEKFLLITDRISLSPEQTAILPDAQLAYRSYPAWFEHFNYLKWLDRSRTFSMYAIERRTVGVSPLSSAQKTTIR